MTRRESEKLKRTLNEIVEAVHADDLAKVEQLVNELLVMAIMAQTIAGES